MPFPRRKVLLFTNSEHGQANVFLATSHALLQLGAEVHFASFPAIENTVKALSKDIRFHAVDGVDMKTAYPRDEVARSGLEGKTPGFWSMPAIFRICLRTVMPWSGPEYVDIYRSVISILQEVVPDIIAIDPAFSPAITACRHLGERFLINILPARWRGVLEISLVSVIPSSSVTKSFAILNVPTYLQHSFRATISHPLALCLAECVLRHPGCRYLSLGPEAANGQAACQGLHRWRGDKSR
jgi:hypothetical protein